MLPIEFIDCKNICLKKYIQFNTNNILNAFQERNLLLKVFLLQHMKN